MAPSADPLATVVVETVMIALITAKRLNEMLARDIHGQKCVVDFAHRVSSYLVTTEPPDSRLTELHLLLKTLQPWVGHELKYVFDTFGGDADAFHTFVDALVELNDMNIWFRNHVTSDGNTLDDTRIKAVKMHSLAAIASKTAALNASIETATAPIDRGTTLVDDISTIYKLVVEKLFNNAADEFTLSIAHGKMNLTVWHLGPNSQDYRADLDANVTIDTLLSLAQSHLHKKGSLGDYDQSLKSA
jgi:hypothetical protein